MAGMKRWRKKKSWRGIKVSREYKMEGMQYSDDGKIAENKKKREIKDDGK